MEGRSMATVAEHVPFIDLCRLCEKVCKQKGKKKQKVIDSFVKYWRDFHSKLHKDDTQTVDSFFPALRLLLPQCERDRAAYGIKENTLAKQYISIFCLDKNSPDAQKLLNYRSPKSAKEEAGDFASVAYFVLLKRCPVTGSLKIHDINAHLDKISLGHATKDKDMVKSSLLFMLRNTSAVEQKWLIRMILKDMKMGVSENSVLKTFHEDAVDYYNVTNSLQKVCLKLKDPSIRLHEIEVSVFTPFRPMLSDMATPLEVEKLMQNEQFVIETKFDGERLQLHKDGNKYMYFSRNGHDVTDVYGSSPLFKGSLTPYISKCFKPNVSQCILDGEIVIYSNTLGCIVSKGENADVQALQPDGDYKPCYCVFDILLLNGKVLSNLPLRERITILEDVFTPIESKIRLSTRKEAFTNEQAITALNEAIDSREEGIVLKRLSSIYKPNVRKNGGWLKLKADYIDNLNDDLDLVIIGGYFGEGKRANKISHFLLGVAESPNALGETPSKFLSLSKVGSGYSEKELDELLRKLADHWKVYDAKKPPSQIIIGPGSKERPEVWVEPSKSLIVQVKATEITRSEKFATNCTLRFPRVQKIRYDKSWHECMTLQELEELRKKSEGMLANRYEGQMAEEEPSPKKVKRMHQVAITLAPQFRPADISNVEQVTELFKDKEMCVFCSSLPNKEFFEKSIVQHGGKFVQNPGSGTFCVVADKLTLKINNIIKTNVYDVVKTSWLTKCTDRQCLLPWTPEDIFHATPSTMTELNKDFDKFGDSYTEEVTEDTLRRIFSNIEEDEWKSRTMNNMEIADMEFNYFSQSSIYGLFRICRIYMDNKITVNDPNSEEIKDHLELTALKLRLYGAEITSEIDDSTTHVVMSLKDTSRLDILKNIAKCRKSKRFHIVTEKWVNRSIKHKNLLQEKEFQPMQ